MTAQMVQIDGNRIRELRESQGLTQLYLATAVEVTIDTISRWENKRYPSIKRENGLRLAEALGVQLDEILLIEPSEESKNSDSTSPEDSPNAEEKPSLPINRFHIGLIGGLILCLVSTVGIFHFLQQRPVITAERIMPAHVVPNSPFPVIIRLEVNSKDPVTLILNEVLPPGSSLFDTLPQAGTRQDDRRLRWIQKVSGLALFAYTISIDGNIGSRYPLSGAITTVNDDHLIQVAGQKQIELSSSHWADTNKDNTISDQEILMVYDTYSDLIELDFDIDQVENIWLGNGYTFNQETRTVTIQP